MGYNGGLFDDEEERFLGQHQLRNDFMCRALYLLAFVEPYNNEPDGEYAIPYEDLEVRHLGELYENILEYTVLLADADRIRRRTKKGVEMLLASQTTRKLSDTLIKKGDVYFGESALERKQTGSYYTPESLVRFLNEKTIIQPLIEKFEQYYRQRFDELLEQARKGHDVGTRRGAAQAASALVERFVEEEVLEIQGLRSGDGKRPLSGRRSQPDGRIGGRLCLKRCHMSKGCEFQSLLAGPMTGGVASLATVSMESTSIRWP